jgi:hypothetical protein
LIEGCRRSSGGDRRDGFDSPPDAGLPASKAGQVGQTDEAVRRILGDRAPAPHGPSLAGRHVGWAASAPSAETPLRDPQGPAGSFILPPPPGGPRKARRMRPVNAVVEGAGAAAFGKGDAVGFPSVATGHGGVRVELSDDPARPESAVEPPESSVAALEAEAAPVPAAPPLPERPPASASPAVGVSLRTAIEGAFDARLKAGLEGKPHVMVGFDRYRFGTEPLVTHGLANCISIIAFDPVSKSAVLAHYDTAFALSGHGRAANGAPRIRKHLDDIKAVLSEHLKQCVVASLAGSPEPVVEYRVALGAAWKTIKSDKEDRQTYANARSAISTVFGVDIGSVPLGVTVVFDPRNDTLTSWPAEADGRRFTGTTGLEMHRDGGDDRIGYRTMI